MDPTQLPSLQYVATQRPPRYEIDQVPAGRIQEYHPPSIPPPIYQAIDHEHVKTTSEAAAGLRGLIFIFAIVFALLATSAILKIVYYGERCEVAAHWAACVFGIIGFGVFTMLVYGAIGNLNDKTSTGTRAWLRSLKVLIMYTWVVSTISEVVVTLHQCPPGA